MNGSWGSWLQLLTGGGLIGGAWKASAAIRDFRHAVELLTDVLLDHIRDHPGPTTTPKETPDGPQ